MNRTGLLCTKAAGLLLVPILFCLWLFGGGDNVTVTVVNRGAIPLHGVTVRVTGESYALGTLAPGERRETRVAPRGESNVEVDWGSPRGEAHHGVVDCYFESGYHGSVLVEIDGFAITRTENHIQIGAL